MLRVAFVLEGKERADDLVSCLDDARAATLAACAAEHALELELANLLAHLGAEQRARIAA